MLSYINRLLRSLTYILLVVLFCTLLWTSQAAMAAQEVPQLKYPSYADNKITSISHIKQEYTSALQTQISTIPKVILKKTDNKTLSSSLERSDTLVINWKTCLGGTKADEAVCIQPTSDLGYVIVGTTSSSDGQISRNQGKKDIWIVKLSAYGSIQWSRTLGGMGDDTPASVVVTYDGGYFILGTTSSTDGDVSGNHGSYDIWAVRLNSKGDIIWKRCFGGRADDTGAYGRQTWDGGFIISGTVQSTDGDVSGNHGSADIWVAKLTYDGRVTWQRCYGGSGYDGASSVIQTLGNGYLVIGWTGSSDWDVTENHGMDDLWVIKIDLFGNINWQRCYGGRSNDYGYAAAQTNDWGYFVTGATWSDDGDISSNHGNRDLWILRITQTGSLIWSRCYGGSLNDGGSDIILTPDNGCIIAGSTKSNDGDVSGNHGSGDFWLLKANQTGGIEWEYALGGSDDDWVRSVRMTRGGGYIMAGGTNSNNGDVIGNHGISDFWIVALKQITPERMQAAFSAEPRSGPAPLAVWFSDRSSGNPIWWDWNFGDGGKSNNQNPVHWYYQTGRYPVSLTVSNLSSRSYLYQSGYITVNGSLDADFSGYPRSGKAPLNVRFQDLTKGDPKGWYWEFGDGTFDTIRNPVHTYMKYGVYNINLTVTGQYGARYKVSKACYISVYQ